MVTLMAAFWASCLTRSGSLTAPQQNAINRLVARWVPKIETTAVEPVYPYADGALVDRAQGTVAAHTPCGWKVVASVHGVDYYNERVQARGRKTPSI
jgi:hypothetical protein